MAGVDVNQLAYVLVGLGPVELVAPRFLHTIHGRRLVCSVQGVVRSASAAAAPRKSASACSTSAGVLARIARRAMRRAARRDAAQHLLRQADGRRRHAELGQAEPDEQRQQHGIGGHLAADGDRMPRRRAARTTILMVRIIAECSGS